eukprot:15065.XXX_761693_761054_1 [CDS] Oithona nana genome sequencing.
MISTHLVLALSLVSVMADESNYYNDLQGYSQEQATGYAQDPASINAALAQFLTERQDFQDPILVSGAIGVGNLLATGLAWANNRAEIDNLRTRVEKLESLLKTTCNKVNDVGTAADFTGTESTNIAANTADGNTAQGAVLTRLAAVSNIGSCSL